MLDEKCVACIKESIKPLALPAKLDIDAGSELGGDSLEGVHGDPIGAPTLDPANHASRNVRTSRQPRLREPSSKA
jgi:hypothetical protein